MGKSVLILEMPELDDEAAVVFLHILQDLTNAFETHYLSQIKRHYEKLYRWEAEQDLF
jgi:hypothetical protein